MKNARVNEIDLLRFLAALAVVFFHYSFRGYAADARSVMPYPLLAPVSKYGYLGVQLFFMISGFVILMTASSGSLRSFVISRLVRLYPAFWVCCTATALVIAAIGAPYFIVSWQQYLINMTMLNGFVDVPSVDGVYWSLFVEIRFYALVCVVLVLGRIHQAQQILTLWLAATMALQLQLFTSYSLGQLLIVDYSAFFIAGATFYLIWSEGATRTRLATITLCWGLAVSQTVGALPGIEEHFKTSINGIAVAALVTMFFLAILAVSVRRTGKLGRIRWPLAGALTYPLYLLHQNIGFSIFNSAYPQFNSHALLWGTILLMLGASYAIHILIEKNLASPMKLALVKLCASMGWKNTAKE